MANLRRNNYRSVWAWFSWWCCTPSKATFIFIFIFIWAAGTEGESSNDWDKLRSTFLKSVSVDTRLKLLKPIKAKNSIQLFSTANLLFQTFPHLLDSQLQWFEIRWPEILKKNPVKTLEGNSLLWKKSVSFFTYSTLGAKFYPKNGQFKKTTTTNWSFIYILIRKDVLFWGKLINFKFDSTLKRKFNEGNNELRSFVIESIKWRVSH